MTRKVTAKDVALATGASPAAVSRAFRPDSPIAEGLRNHILTGARKLGYIPPSAQLLAQMAMGTITLVAGDLENPFYPMAANALSHAIHARGRRMSLHAVPPHGSVDTVMNQVLSYRTDAVIVTSALMSSQLARACRENRLPVVLFNRVQTDARMTAVTCDNYGGGRLVAERFLLGGRHCIAVIGGRPDTSTHIERLRGFCDRLEEAGVQPTASPSGNYDYATSFSVAQDLLRTSLRPDAIFCLNDVMALAALDAAREAGLAIPDDLAVIGFDDIPMAGWFSYRLTTVRQPLERMVADTLDLVEKLIVDPSAEGMIHIAPVTLVTRNSG